MVQCPSVCCRNTIGEKELMAMRQGCVHEGCNMDVHHVVPMQRRRFVLTISRQDPALCQEWPQLRSTRVARPPEIPMSMPSHSPPSDERNHRYFQLSSRSSWPLNGYPGFMVVGGGLSCQNKNVKSTFEVKQIPACCGCDHLPLPLP